MAKQAEAEREKRAKVTLAEGELQAAQRLADAARTLSSEPAGLQLRYLQTLAEIAGGGKNSTTIFPVPIDLVGPFMDRFLPGHTKPASDDREPLGVEGGQGGPVEDGDG